MRTATFIEQSTLKHPTVSSQVIKKEVPWQDAFDALKVGSIFEATFKESENTIEFKIIGVVEDADRFGLGGNKTFWVEATNPKLEPDDVPF